MNRAAYENLVKAFDEIVTLGEVLDVLRSDMAISMPRDSEQYHVRQIVLLGNIRQEKIARPEIYSWLDAAETDCAALTADEKANLRVMRHLHTASVCLPDDLVAACAQNIAEGEYLHSRERPVGDWQKVLPFFRETVELTRKAAAMQAAALKLPTTYDALIDRYAPGWLSSDLDREFEKLEARLKELLPRIKEKQAALPPVLPVPGPFAESRVADLCREFCKKAGFNFDRGRLDFIDAHPTFFGKGDDTRIAGRINPQNFLQSLYDSIHEGGHGLYLQNLPAAWRHQPAGLALDDIHESQSLIWEFIVGKSMEFCRHLSARSQEVLGAPGDPALSAENLFALQTRVRPSLIRIDPDTSEPEYPFHIMLRYKLEKDLVSGALDPADLPETWNNLMEDMLGIRPENNAQGCMQDVHWFCGLWAYLPTYIVGYMAAAQFYATAERAHPEIPGQIASGNFSTLSGWLRDNVQSKGSLLGGKELIRQATGEDLNSFYLIDHLSRRYLGEPYTAPAPAPAPAPSSPNTPAPA